ncbi:hypothetical protein BpHYR1_020577 [Brachionus plicatilis]|uniref:Uncharacterized protein n=1 Tax=Brachionus plicatilis TaxID=10195 RepID=A0A3M7QI22_BRAPC|nr:hypothetical protein BpHYR1_020577 [Brachionus plicatilis]
MLDLKNGIEYFDYESPNSKGLHCFRISINHSHLTIFCKRRLKFLRCINRFLNCSQFHRPYNHFN